MSVPLFDLGRLGPEVDDAVREAALRVLGHRGYVLGSEVEAFESDLCAYLGGGHAIGMSSGTDAQLALLMAMGIGHGDAVISTPYTFLQRLDASIARVLRSSSATSIRPPS